MNIENDTLKKTLLDYNNNLTNKISISEINDDEILRFSLLDMQIFAETYFTERLKEMKKKYNVKIKPLKIDFDKPIEHKENNDFSQRVFKDNEKIFRGQCKVVAEALGRGERLSVISAIQSYGIGDLRRRIKDLKDNYGVKNITWEMKGRSKVWFLK